MYFCKVLKTQMKKKLKKVYLNKYSSELRLHLSLGTFCIRNLRLFIYLLLLTIPSLFFSKELITNVKNISILEKNTTIIKIDVPKSLLSDNKITKKGILLKKTIVKHPKKIISEKTILQSNIWQTQMFFYLKNEELTKRIFNSTLNSPEPFFIKNNFFLRITFYEEIFQLANLYLENTNQTLYHLYQSKKVENFLFTRPPPYHLK